MANTGESKALLVPSKLGLEEPEFWKVRKVIELDEMKHKRGCVTLNKEMVEEHIVKYWNHHKIMRAQIDYEKVRVLDLDTNTEHMVWFSYKRAHDSYYLEGPWKHNFVDRRLLSIGHEVGFVYDQDRERLLFRVLRRGDASTLDS